MESGIRVILIRLGAATLTAIAQGVLAQSGPANFDQARNAFAIAHPLTVSRTYSLSSDTLFGFGKSTLRPAGEARLDELAAKLGDIDIDRITDTGHADRIGSSRLNHNLSVSRAETVKAYLASKGIQLHRITAVGKGDTQPVTRPDACPGPTSAKLIACLQPDRRVDIEVLGTSK